MLFVATTLILYGHAPDWGAVAQAEQARALTREEPLMAQVGDVASAAKIFNDGSERRRLPLFQLAAAPRRATESKQRKEN